MYSNEFEKTVRQENVKGFKQPSDTALELDGTPIAAILSGEKETDEKDDKDTSDGNEETGHAAGKQKE